MKWKNFFKFFLGPMIIGMIIASFDHLLINFFGEGSVNFYNNAYLTRIIYTFSSIITSFLSWFAPIMTLGFILSAMINLKGNAKKVVKRFGIVLITTLSILSFISVLVGSELITLFPKNLITTFDDVTYLNPYFYIDLEPLFNVFTALILGIIVGLFIPKNSTLEKVVSEFESIILKIMKNIIYPIMPVWVIGTFAKITFENGFLNIVLFDLFMSIIVLVVQFVWLLIMFSIASKYIKVPLKHFIKKAVKIYLIVVTMAGNTAGVIVPIIVDEQKEINIDESIAKFVSSTSFNLPGSLISNIVFMMGTAYMFDYSLTILDLVTYIIALQFILIASPAISGGVWTLTQTILNPILGFSNEMISIMGAFYFKQGTSNAAVNNCADFYLSALSMPNEMIEIKKMKEKNEI